MDPTIGCSNMDNHRAEMQNKPAETEGESLRCFEASEC